MANEEDAKERSATAAVAKNMRAIREAQGMTLTTLSKRLGQLGLPTRITALSRIELGQRGVNVEELVLIAKILGASVLDFLVDPASQFEREASPVVEGFLAAASVRMREQEELRRLDRHQREEWGKVVDYAAQGDDQFEATAAVLRKRTPDDGAHDYAERLTREVAIKRGMRAVIYRAGEFMVDEGSSSTTNEGDNG